MNDEYVDEPLTEEEMEQAKLNVDLIENNLKALNFDIENIKHQLEIRLPQRQAKAAGLEALRTKELDVKRFNDQLKMYKTRVETGNKKVPKAAGKPASDVEV